MKRVPDHKLYHDKHQRRGTETRSSGRELLCCSLSCNFLIIFHFWVPKLIKIKERNKLDSLRNEVDQLVDNWKNDIFIRENHQADGRRGDRTSLQPEKQNPKQSIYFYNLHSVTRIE